MKHEGVNIGEILKKEREKRGLSLSDIAKETLIREFYLEQIENNEFPRYDGYIAAYIRKYAEALGIDPEPLVSAYKDLFPEEVHPEILNKEETKSKFPFLISVFVVVIILFITAIFAFSHMRNVKPSVNNQNVETPSQSNSSEKTPLSEKKNPPETKNENISSEKKPEGIKVTVTVDSKCWLGVTIDGKYTQLMLYKGQSKTFVGKKYIKILYGNAMHAYVTVNGKDEGVVSKDKRVVEVEYKSP